MTQTARAMKDIPPSRLRSTACASCGYRFEKNDEMLHIHQTGDYIHKDCRMEYFEDNISEFADEEVLL